MPSPYLSLEEIDNGDRFEELVAAYFRDLKTANSSISQVEVKPPGVGTDGGRDILIDLLITDSIKDFERRWIVQCKFHQENISPKHVSDINIPSLIHSYGASGYLLICKERPTTKLTYMFEGLNKECKLGYRYEIWSGDLFRGQLNTLPSESAIFKTFFPKYFFDLKKISESQTT